MRNWQAVWKSLEAPLYGDLKGADSYFSRAPLLAHYTTAFVFEQMVKNNEVWFSNPLLMNDLEEVRFGINEGTQAFLENKDIQSALSPETQQHFENALWSAHRHFDKNHAFDTYILCLCEHSRDEMDGLLSMWRGYGDSGRGVAVVFDGSVLAETQDSPLIVSKVTYATEAQRRSWFADCAARFADAIVAERYDGDELTAATWALFARLRLFSLFTKHLGFAEEREWRIAYMPERDGGEDLKPYFGYHNGPRGIEPKLKLPFVPNPAFGGQDVSLERLVHSIILGPSASSLLSVRSTQRMLETLRRPALVGKVRGSAIPYRATP